MSVEIRETFRNEVEAHLAKVHTLDTLATQRRTDRRTGAGLASADDELDELVLLQNVPGHGEGCGDVWWGRRRRQERAITEPPKRTKSEAAL
jgi:hypothetical protein